MKVGSIEFLERLSDLIDDTADAIAESKALRRACAQLRKDARRILHESRHVVIGIRQQRSARRSLVEY